MAEYDTITVPHGQRHTENVGPGETLSNKLYDISASGADLRINTSGNNWTVRNIGVRGKTSGILLLPMGSGTVEHFYAGDGALDKSGGKFVWVSHSNSKGPLNFRRVYVSGHSDNGIYGSPTAEHLAGAEMHVEDSYFDSNNSWQMKIGSPEATCTVRNTVIRTDHPQRAALNTQGGINMRAAAIIDNRAAPGHRNRVRFENCDIHGPITAECGSITDVVNCRWEGRFFNKPGNDPHGCDPDVAGEINRNGVSGNPNLSPRAGVPTTPQEAASGTSSAGQPGDPPSDGTGGGGGGGGGSGGRNELVIFVPEGIRNVEYTTTVNGPVEKANLSEKISAGQNDQIINNNDGTWTIRGRTGNGFGDAYYVDGQVLSNSANGRTEIRVNGDTITGDDMPYPPQDTGGGDGGDGGDGGGGSVNTAAAAVALAVGVYGLREYLENRENVGGS